MEKLFHKYDRDGNKTISKYEIGDIVREDSFWNPDAIDEDTI